MIVELKNEFYAIEIHWAISEEESDLGGMCNVVLQTATCS